ncbi:hypothetical protein AMECASPLE_021844 [Ameca splendens]|uniref:Uncharacterized protein n=1 Tax=Ameca splendens TaxID=208324 RepID=A0ABV0Z1N9_9TELE
MRSSSVSSARLKASFSSQETAALDVNNGSSSGTQQCGCFDIGTGTPNRHIYPPDSPQLQLGGPPFSGGQRCNQYRWTGITLPQLGTFSPVKLCCTAKRLEDNSFLKDSSLDLMEDRLSPRRA